MTTTAQTDTPTARAASHAEQVEALARELAAFLGGEPVLRAWLATDLERTLARAAKDLGRLAALVAREGPAR